MTEEANRLSVNSFFAFSNKISELSLLSLQDDRIRKRINKNNFFNKIIIFYPPHQQLQSQHL